MEYYKYHEEIENNGNLNSFFDKNNFVGYILPDGSIYPCEKHNISSVESFFNLVINFLYEKYDDKEKFLEKKSKDKLLQLLLNFFWKLSREEVNSLHKFMKLNKLDLSNILVSLIDCHLVTRLNRKILTASSSHELFYNYLLMGFEIETVPKIIYKDGEYIFYRDSLYNNDFLYDQINRIKNETQDDERMLFFR